MGLAPRELWGWEPDEETVYEHDADGRVVKARTRREARFDREQYLLVIASDELESDIGPHGQPMSEAISDDADLLGDHPRYFYRAGVPRTDPAGNTFYGPVTDWAEKAVLDAQDAYRASLPKDAKVPNGLHWPVTKVLIGNPT